MCDITKTKLTQSENKTKS